MAAALLVQGYLAPHPLGPYRRPMPRVLGGPRGVDVFLWARYPCRVPNLIRSRRESAIERGSAYESPPIVLLEE